MSWKLRRVGIKQVSRKQALVIRKIFIASLLCSVIGLLVFVYPPLAPVFAIPWFLSLVTTPWLFCMGSAVGMWKVTPKRRAELDEEIWDKWISDADKKNTKKELTPEETWEKWIKDAKEKKEIWFRPPSK